MLEFATNYYYIILCLQAVCAMHCFKKGTQSKWIWLIVFLPLVGCLIYIFSEMITGKQVNQVQAGAGAIFNPTGKIKKLKSNLEFRDTFDNRIALADAYLEAGQFSSAISLYEQSLVDTFSQHEHGSMQLIIAYYHSNRFEEVVTIAQKIYALPQFVRSKPHMMYAVALGKTNRPVEAEREFLMMKGKFSNYECRYHYAQFLSRYNRSNEAVMLLKEIVQEAEHLNSNERRPNKEWFAKAKETLKAMPVQ